MTISPIIEDFINFIDASPTAWHAVSAAQQRLMEAGFSKLAEHEAWKIQPGGRYVVERNGSSLCAFVAPRNLPKRLRLLASHTDSPGLKLKPKAEFRKYQAVLLGVEVYGSPLLSSWLNRDLGIAGRVLYKDSKGRARESLVRLDRYPVTIPQLAIHLDREVNEKGLQLNKQDHLHALAGLEASLKDSSFLETALKEEVDLGQLIGHDLFLYPLEKPRLIGFDRSLLASYRIDSLASIHAALTALLQQLNPLDEEIKMVVFWDNEEVGSQTAQGAESSFFPQVLERLLASYQGSREDYFRLLNRSSCISIDLAHALHPNYADKHDPQHQPLLGGGVVLKSNAQQRYATSARSLLPVQLCADEKGLPLQKFASRNDIPCGTTIGPIHAFRTGMQTVDIGCSQLSMHSSRELMACQDHLDMCKLLESLLERQHWPDFDRD